MKEQDNLDVLRAIHKKPKTSQREMAKFLGFSLGKLNYCLKALKNKGFIKIQNFQKQPDRIKYIQYVLTPKGLLERGKLTLNFMKRKLREYDELKKELEDQKIEK
tara:strand:- start:2199 stop:2513 length:315 start_codon:yes stop_codon:yes gene_type:complete